MSAVTSHESAKPKAADPQVSLDDYFDQLDAAFSNLDASQRGGSLSDQSAPGQSATKPSELDWAQKHTPGVPEGEKPSGLARTPGAGQNEFEWIATHAADVAGVANLDFFGLTDVATKPVEAPVPPRPVPVTETVLPPISVVERVAPELVHQPTPVAPVPSPQPRVAPFDESSRTAAELPRPVVSVPMADAFVALLAAEQGETLTIPGVFAPPPAAASAGITDELVERVAERVVNRLSDSVVRETVRDTVSRVAERLVRDEIQRIKKMSQ